MSFLVLSDWIFKLPTHNVSRNFYRILCCCCLFLVSSLICVCKFPIREICFLYSLYLISSFLWSPSAVQSSGALLYCLVFFLVEFWHLGLLGPSLTIQQTWQMSSSCADPWKARTLDKVSRTSSLLPPSIVQSWETSCCMYPCEGRRVHAI